MDLYMSAGLGIGLAGAILVFLQGNTQQPSSGNPGNGNKLPFYLEEVLDEDNTDCTPEEMLKQLENEADIIARTRKVRELTHMTEDDMRESLAATRRDLQLQIDARVGRSAVGTEKPVRPLRIARRGAGGIDDDGVMTIAAVLDWGILLMVLCAALYVWNQQSGGQILRWAWRLFPRELQALGVAVPDS